MQHSEKIKPKRRRRRSDCPEVVDAKMDRMYFNQETQAAITLYQTFSVGKDRDKLYLEKILPAFQKLVENLINIHKFTGLYDSYDDLKNDCINFLFETIHKFDPNRGTNAFSYFNVVAKNWLIIKTKQKNIHSKKVVSLDNTEDLTNYELGLIEQHQSLPSQETMFGFMTSSENVLKMMYEIRKYVKTENELSCINSIITIFENIDSIDLLNKSAVLLYMKELSGLSPKQLTTSLQTIKRHYKKMRIHQND